MAGQLSQKGQQRHAVAFADDPSHQRAHIPEATEPRTVLATPAVKEAATKAPRATVRAVGKNRTDPLLAFGYTTMGPIAQGGFSQVSSHRTTAA